ncbi:MAG: diguanylate cyclase [Steroidobacteraceae bacterium]|jgi:diguanylate cyclase (GGDEF)-like protein
MELKYTARLSIWPLLLLLGLSLPSRSPAACIADPDSDIRQMQTLIGKDAVQALKQIQRRLDALPVVARAEPRTAAHRASLYAAQAQAYEILERSSEARSAAAAGLTLATNAFDPVHLELLSAAAQNVYDEAGIAAAIKNIEAARVVQPPESRAAICLLVTRGLLEHRQDRADLAIVTLTQAYRASSGPTLSEPHALAASVLSVVMRSMGDYAQALALNQEEIDWDMSRDATLSLSVSRFMRGQILKSSGSYGDAIAEFAEARRLSLTLNDQLGVAYADLRICEAQIGLGDLAAAQRECDSAGRIFAAANAPDSMKETLGLQARIDLGEGRADKALAGLNRVLDHDGADMPPLDVAALYESRARANAALHDYKNAYGDLREYSQRYAAATEAERHRQAGALRARFETDREIERNASLKRELAQSQEQATRQAKRLRWNAVGAVTGACVIALLMYFLAANIRYRKQMVKLASQDGLTGLPNRRRTAQFATAAVQTARTQGSALTIAILDMDHFKAINDCCGHATGDAVLKAFARVTGEALRTGDLLGRWGGEEFLLVMPESTPQVAAATLERLRTLMYGIHLPASGAGLRVSLSAGIAEFDANVRSLDDFIARADGALYAAKSAGRDCVRVADASQITGSHAARRALRQSQAAE